MNMRLFDLVGCLSSVLDLISPEVVGHHFRVGALAYRLGEVAGLSGRTLTDLTLAGQLHDVGAFSLKDRLAALVFDTDDRTHAETGFRLLSGYPEFALAAEMIRAHHTPWSAQEGGQTFFTPEEDLGNLLYLADRVDVLLPRSSGQSVDREALLTRIERGRGRKFNPLWVEALEAVAGEDDFWEHILYAGTGRACLLIPGQYNPVLSGQSILNLTRLFSQIIDFRCRFTAAHSCSVSAVATVLGRELGLDAPCLELLGIAGQLHDIGKLCVPSEIILKPEGLSPREMSVMRGHVTTGQHVLVGVPGLSEVATWVGQHHERLDGTGYPLHSDASQIELESRVLAVADVFSALIEDRPYRQGMDLDRAVLILEDMADEMALDPDVVCTLARRREEVDESRSAAQATALADFERFALDGLVH